MPDADEPTIELDERETLLYRLGRLDEQLDQLRRERERLWRELLAQRKTDADEGRRAP